MEHFFQCPYCLENISMVIEPEEGSQSYIEDCEVCCRPIKVTFAINGEYSDDQDEPKYTFECEKT